MVVAKQHQWAAAVNLQGATTGTYKPGSHIELVVM